MGVDVWSLDFLLKFRKQIFGQTLLLGRQGFHIRHDNGLARKVLGSHDPDIELESISGGPGHADDFFRYLGSETVTSMDISKYEGADLIFDLNNVVPEELHGQFDVIFDGGTLEHVYNFPIAMSNVKAMLRVGGLFLMVTPANNFLGHGFYQFSTELMYRVFSEENGYYVELMQLVELDGYPDPKTMVDPKVAGRRIEIGRTRMPTYLMTAARKVRSTSAVAVMQSDYVAIWQK